MKIVWKRRWKGFYSSEIGEVYSHCGKWYGRVPPYVFKNLYGPFRTRLAAQKKVEEVHRGVDVSERRYGDS